MAQLIGSEAVTTPSGSSTLIAGILVFVVIAILIIVGIVIVAIKVSSLVKKRSDIFYRIRTERIKLCSAHRRYPKKVSKFRLYKYWKNVPIRLQYFNKQSGTFGLTKPIAYYRGDMQGPEGNLMVSFYMPGNNTWLVFPKTEILIINNKQTRTFKIGKELITKTLPTAKDIVQFDDDTIILKCDAISDSGMFYIPVLHDADDNIIDMTPAAMTSMEDVAATKIFYESLDMWAKNNRKAVDANPNVRIHQKTNDQNQSVEQNDDFLK